MESLLGIAVQTGSLGIFIIIVVYMILPVIKQISLKILDNNKFDIENTNKITNIAENLTHIFEENNLKIKKYSNIVNDKFDIIEREVESIIECPLCLKKHKIILQTTREGKELIKVYK